MLMCGWRSRFSVPNMAPNLSWMERTTHGVRLAYLKRATVSHFISGHTDSSHYQLLRCRITSVQKASIWSQPSCHIPCTPFLSILQIFQQKGQTQLGESSISIYHQGKYIIKSVLGFQYIKLLLSLITAPSNIHLLENTWCYWEGSRDFHAERFSFPRMKSWDFCQCYIKW